MLVFHRYVNFHDIKCKFVFYILTDIVTILSMAIAHAKVPEVLDLSEIFNHEEVILVCLRDSVGCLTGSSQVCELSNVVLDLANGLGR